MKFIRSLLFLLAFMVLAPVFAAADNRADCDSCRFKVNSLDQPFSLTGKWLFTRDDNPHNKDVDIDTSSWKTIKAPGPWKKAYGDGKNYTIGWYRGVFEFNPALIGQDVVFLVDAYMGRVAVFVDGTEVFRRPNNINVERYYSIQPIPVRFKIAQATQTVAIRVETQAMTGVYQLPFELRHYSVDDTNLVLRHFLGGEMRTIVAFVVLFFGLFFLLVYAKTRYSLYLVASLASITAFPFFAAPSDTVFKVFTPETPYFIHLVGIFTYFFHFWFSQYFYKFLPKTTKILGVIGGAMALPLGMMVFYPNLDLLQKLKPIYMLVCMTYGWIALYLLVRGVMQRNRGARVLLFGMMVVLVAGIHDMFIAFGLIDSMMLQFFGVATFTGTMLYVASNTFANTFLENRRLVKDLKVTNDQLKDMNDNLENIVSERTLQLRQKTNDIQNMLQNMPQGILTVVGGGVIHSEYSAYLETIFETQAIAGRNVMELVFTDSDLGSDVLSQVETVTGACIGEDAMNFAFNMHLLVTEFQKRMADGRVKSLELSWSPICDESETLDKLMLCVRDVTELKKLAAEASQQKRELEIIGQILAVNQEKFHEFIDSSEKFVEENATTIQHTEHKEADVIGRLFRNMHTIKGNARTYGLLHLTNKVHETEQKYDELRKKPEVEWEQEPLLAQLQEVKVLIEEYAKINDVKLGRKGPGRRGNVDKFLMVEKEQILQSIQLLERVDKTSVTALHEVIGHVRRTLNLIGTETMGEIVAGVVDSLPSLAKELGKEAPKVAIEDHGILLRNQIASLLKNVFMHLLRNSMDHGLETAAERQAQGKTAAGHIHLQLSLSEGSVWFTLRDDGRGLAIARLRRKAIENNLLPDAEHCPAEVVAQLIFASGFSTAEKVTEVSGRGVGMDAVKGFIEREGGKIEIRLLDDYPDADFHSFETTICLPDKFAVDAS